LPFGGLPTRTAQASFGRSNYGVDEQERDDSGMTPERNFIAVLAGLEPINALAAGIERDLQLGGHKHYAVYEEDLQSLWPLKDGQREAKLAQFAQQHGFRLLFYQKGLCAIVDKGAPKAHD
jgi:hypothetical protein